MKQEPSHTPPPRLADEPTAEGAVLRHARDEGIPPGTQALIWERLQDQRRRLVDNESEELRLVDLLRRADRGVEPPPAAQDRVWRQMLEEARARQGLAEPARLLDTEDFAAPLLAGEASLDPPYGRRARVYRALAPRPRRASRFTWVAAALSMAAVAAIVLAIQSRPLSTATPSLTPALALNGGSAIRVGPDGNRGPLNALSVGDRLELGSDGDPARWHLDGVGDCELSGPGARLVLAEADAAGIRLELQQGGLAIHAVKRSKESPLIIKADGVETRVVGTILAVEAGPLHASVFVHEGLVEVRAPGNELVRVGAGEGWPKGSPRPDWADDAMQRLAGTPLASHAPGPVELVARPSTPASLQPRHAATASHRDSTPSPHLARSATVPVAKSATTAAVPTTSAPPPSLAEPTLHGRPGFLASDTTTVVTTPPDVPDASRARPAATGTHAVAAGPRFDLTVEGIAYDGQSIEQITTAIEGFEKAGPPRFHDLAVAYSALHDRADAKSGTKRHASLRLVEVLDEKMGAIQEALSTLREIAGKLGEPADSSAVRLSILRDTVELGRADEALSAAADCVLHCLPEHAVFARVLQARLLAEAGRLDEARAAAREAKKTSSGYAKTAFYFAQQADLFEANGQHDRARVDAKIAIELDPGGLDAARLRLQFP